VKKILCLLHKHQFGDAQFPISVEYNAIYKTLKTINKKTYFFDTHKKNDIFLNNISLLKFVKKIKPEIIFCHLSSYEIYSETFEIIKSICSPTIINWCSDDSWRYKQHSVLIAKSFDLMVTTYKEAHINNLSKKINSILSNWGCPNNWFIEPKKKNSYLYDICFIGNAYMGRKKIIKNLQDLGFSIQCFGKGWKDAVANKDLPRTINNSKINLNFSKSRGNKPQTKARVFEITGSGGFCLTEYSNEVKNLFKENHEIVIFKNLNELIYKIKYYLQNEYERKFICKNGYSKCYNEYSYKSIMINILKKISKIRYKKIIIPRAYKAYNLIRTNPHWLLRLYKCVSQSIFKFFFSKQNAVKLSRRLLFEIEWRLRREKTYSLNGWCNNLFNYH